MMSVNNNNSIHSELINLQDEIYELFRLSNIIKENNRIYYSENSSKITDSQYDELKLKFNTLKKKLQIALNVRDLNELQSIIKQCAKDDKDIDRMLKECRLVDECVGFDPSDKFEKVEHSTKMLSLQNAFDKEDIEDFICKIKSFLSISNYEDIKFILEPKIDGVSFAARYRDGKYELGLTRGNGEFGENITENLIEVLGFPKKINSTENIEIRGEVYLPYSSFKELELDRDNFFLSTPRNIASGSLRSLDPNVTKFRKLKYFAYYLKYENRQNIDQITLLRDLKSLGFIVNDFIEVANNSDQVQNIYNSFVKMKSELDYGTDGLVIKLNDCKLQARLSETNKYPRWAIAYKMPSKKITTQIIDIVEQVGKNGVITPVAILSPVYIDGCRISRATLHNFFEIERKDIRKNDFIILERAGDVIPHVISVILEKRLADSPKYLRPTHCICCGCKLVEFDKFLKCVNITSCRDQILKRIEFFVSKEAFDISGMSSKIILKLWNLNIIRTPSDIFSVNNEINYDILCSIDGFGKKSINNLFQNINNSKTIGLERFINSFCITNIGLNISKIIAENIDSAKDLLNPIKIKEKLGNVDKIGEKIIESILSFFSIKQNQEELLKLIDLLNITKNTPKVVKSSISGKKIVFSGSLSSMGRREAKVVAEKLGAKVANSVSKNIDFIVCGENSGSKIKIAKEIGVNILNEDEWNNIASESVQGDY